MFTGLIQGPGKVLSVTGRQGEGSGNRETRLEIRPEAPIRDYVRGESIAVNGVCLTVETFAPDRFSVFASAETLRLTNLSNLRTGMRVNLERALALGDRLGGHLVSGHVDCLARIGETTQVGQSRWFRLLYPGEFSPLVVTKGSVTLDGISLTVNQCGEGFLEVNIIPETWQNTTISEWRPGRDVNMETDLIGKYVQRMLGPWTGTSSSPAEQRPSGTSVVGGGGISEAFLREHGF
ncbi:riboflavin synthase [Desulfonatronum sp. SC1]|uniref:riboflavin synthase n=1 Tax=Desulfonatronum sp. SC1 TaxID=2109626 RepID=UPI000D30EB98|nr:riboflavin synthase [Desulfonatronum sp. SC1]PTN36874.1 riboflavin synthase [Desulfonatronum sp. SC1]